MPGDEGHADDDAWPADEEEWPADGAGQDGQWPMEEGKLEGQYGEWPEKVGKVEGEHAEWGKVEGQHAEWPNLEGPGTVEGQEHWPAEDLSKGILPDQSDWDIFCSVVIASWKFLCCGFRFGLAS